MSNWVDQDIKSICLKRFVLTKNKNRFNWSKRFMLLAACIKYFVRYQTVTILLLYRPTIWLTFKLSKLNSAGFIRFFKLHMFCTCVKYSIWYKPLLLFFLSIIQYIIMSRAYMFTFQNNTGLKLSKGISYAILYLDVQQEIIKTKTSCR